MNQREHHVFRHLNETPGGVGTLTTSVDYTTGVIRGAGTGFWSVTQIDAHFMELSRHVRALHRRSLSVSLVVDLRDSAPAQSQDVSERLKAGVMSIYQAGDRVALVLATSLAKMQLRRVLDLEFHEFFLSLSAAEKWAFAGKQSAGPPQRALAG